MKHGGSASESSDTTPGGSTVGPVDPPEQGAQGQHDGYKVVRAPDSVSMAAVTLATGAGNALSPLETTLLKTVDKPWPPCARLIRSVPTTRDLASEDGRGVPHELERERAA